MKRILLSAFIGIAFLACTKKQEEISTPPCAKPTPTPICLEIPPTDEWCTAYFNRWFYNEATNQCQEIGYSGCSPYGFATQTECEECVCN